MTNKLAAAVGGASAEAKLHSRIEKENLIRKANALHDTSVNTWIEKWRASIFPNGPTDDASREVRNAENKNQ